MSSITRTVIVVESADCNPTTVGGSVHVVGERRARGDLVRRGPDHAAHRLQVCRTGTGQGEVDDGAGPAARQVADESDVAIGDHEDGAVDAAETGEAHGDLFDHTGHATDRDGVADVVLILHRHEDAREVVAHDLLRAEARGSLR